MKKKAVAAMLVMCMALSSTAYAKGKDTKDTKETQETTKSDEKSDKKSKKADPVKLVSVEDLSDYVTVGEYKGLKLDRITQTVTDDDVQAEIDYDLQDKGDEVTDGAAEGDAVTINYTGTVDGEEFDGGSAEDYELTLGEGTMIDGFEDGIVGMKPGETKELDLTFPEDYDENLGGKAVVFQVTLQKDIRKAELTDDWVTANTDYKNVDEYKEGVRKDLEEQASASADSELYDTAWSEVEAASEVKKYPEADVNTAIAELKAQYEAYLETAGVELSDFLEAQDMSEDDYDKECKESAEDRVKQNMLVQSIMNTEGLSIEDNAEDLESGLCAQYGVSNIDEIKDAYGLSDEEITEAKALLCVEQFIVKNATVEEKTGSEDDLIANEDAYGLEADDNGDVEYEIVDESGEDTADDSEAAE